jgi:copper chaperone
MQVFNVQGMTCAHCVRAVTNAIQGQDPTAQVQIDLAKGEVRVQSQLESEQVVGLIEEEGYAAKRAQ